MPTVLRAEPLTITIGHYTATFCPRAAGDGVSGGIILKLVREKSSPTRGDKLPECPDKYNHFINLANRAWQGRKLEQWRLARNSENGRTFHASPAVGGTTCSVHCKKPVDTAADEHFTDEDYKPLPDETIAAMRNADYSELEQRHAAAYNLDFTQMGPSYEELENQVSDHIERAQKEFPEYLEKAYEDFRTGRIAPVSLAGRPHKTISFSTPTRRGDDQLLKRFLTENGMTEQPEVAIEAPFMSDEALDTVKSSFGVSFAEIRQQHQDMLKAESKGRRYRAVWESPVDKKLTFAVIGISLLAHIGLLVFTAYRDGVPFWSLL